MKKSLLLYYNKKYNSKSIHVQNTEYKTDTIFVQKMHY